MTSLGSAANGLYGSSPGLSSADLGPAGRAIAHRFGAGVPGSGGPAYAAEAMEVLLQAIGVSDGSRASVTAHVLHGRIRNGVLGSFHFDKDGDIDPAGVSIYRILGGHIKLNRAILVPQRLLR